MKEDSVLEEVWAARDAYAKVFGYDVHAMVADLRARDERDPRTIVSLSPRKPCDRRVPEVSGTTRNSTEG
ncbi:hypothetical protein [Tautonia marina]|uniref:hypothetical protein n=1 Tax=Tautonia marina TaxID=2653855 RepID=UPI001260CC6D|nr:hypothetical protein [Tautonia marina]